MTKQRIFLIVLDSFGIGGAADAADYGDAGSNTLSACVRAGAQLPNLERLGLGNIDGVDCLPKPEKVIGAYARLREASKGKDTTIGHWRSRGYFAASAADLSERLSAGAAGCAFPGDWTGRPLQQALFRDRCDSRLRR